MSRVILMNRALYLLDWMGDTLFEQGTIEQRRAAALRVTLEMNREVYNRCSEGSNAQGLLYKILDSENAFLTPDQVTIPDTVPEDIDKPQEPQGCITEVPASYMGPGTVVPIFPIDAGDHVTFAQFLYDALNALRTPDRYRNPDLQQEFSLDRRTGDIINTLLRYFPDGDHMLRAAIDLAAAAAVLERRPRMVIEGEGRFYFYPVSEIEGIEDDEALIRGQPIELSRMDF